MPRALLVSLRDSMDPMNSQEHRCFAARSALDFSDVVFHSMHEEGAPPAWKLRSYDAVFFGGSGAYSILDDVPWIRRSLDVLMEVAHLKIPSWASCFGFQGLALAMGGTVAHDEPATEMGSTELSLTDAGRKDGLFKVLPERFWVQQGHHDRVVTIPDGVSLLATGDVCHAQGFKVDGAPFWASQFHPELTVAWTVERFRFYREHYLDGDGDDVLARLEEGAETAEVALLLARLVRHQF